MSAWAHEMSSSHKQLNKTDSEVLMVCSIPPTDTENPDADLGNATTCQCQTWAYLHLPQVEAEAEVGKPVKSNAVLYCHDGPGWKPPQSMRKAAVKGRDPKGYPYAGQWAAVPLMQSSSSSAPLSFLSLSLSASCASPSISPEILFVMDLMRMT